jgi:hypothetical protein
MMENLERELAVEIGGALLTVWVLTGLPNPRAGQCRRFEPVREAAAMEHWNVRF